MLAEFLLPIALPGTLTSDHVVYFIAPRDMTLLKVSASCKTQDAALTIGTKSPTDDDDAFLDTTTITAGTTLTELTRTDFVGDQYPRISDDDTVIITVGHGANCVDFFALLNFAWG